MVICLAIMRFTVAFDEADGEGIVFFGNYFRLAHRALEVFLPSIQIPWPDWFKNAEWAAPLRHVEADYLMPLRPGEMFEVSVKVSEVGESSVSFSYEFHSPLGQPIAKIKTTHVFIDRKTMRKRPIPAAFRERLTAHRQG